MKKNLKSLPSLLLALLMTLSLMACGGSTAEDSVAASDMAAAESAVEEEYGYSAAVSMTEDAAAEEPAEAAASIRGGGAADGGNVNAETKLVYTAYLEVEALDFDAATAALDTLVEELGGYYERSSVYSYSSRRSASYTVRVPSEHYRAFVDACSDSENCHLNYISEEVEDIGTEYFDAETRLTTLKTKMERLQTLLAQATEMEDIITIETAISETEYEIEYYTSTLNRYDSLVGYATINMEMMEVLQLTEEEEESVLSRLGQELRWGVESFLDLLVELMYWAAYHLIGIVIFLILMIAVVTVVRRAKQKEKLSFKLNRKKGGVKAEETSQPEEDQK